jgi:hypothetical protein
MTLLHTAGATADGCTLRLPCAAIAVCRKVRVVHIAPGYNHPSEDPSFEVRLIVERCSGCV